MLSKSSSLPLLQKLHECITLADFGFFWPGAKIVYTYDVHWQASDVSWASRWDAYLKMPGGRVHWFSILNSLMVVLVMSSIVAMIMMRTIRRDLARYEGLLGDTGGALKVPMRKIALQFAALLLGIFSSVV